MNLRASTKRTGSLMMSVLFFVLAFASYSLFVRPELDKISELRGVLQSKMELLEQQRTVNEQVKNLLSRFKSVSNLESIVSMAIPVNEDFGALLHQLDILAGSSGLTVASIDFRSFNLPTSRLRTGDQADTIGVISERGRVAMEVSLQGSYSALKAFLKLIETNVRILDVKTLSLAAVDQTNASDLFTYKILVEGYFQADRNNSKL
jgi:Tfp pilus assembly protein PilO